MSGFENISVAQTHGVIAKIQSGQAVASGAFLVDCLDKTTFDSLHGPLVKLLRAGNQVNAVETRANHVLRFDIL